MIIITLFYRALASWLLVLKSQVLICHDSQISMLSVIMSQPWALCKAVTINLYVQSLILFLSFLGMLWISKFGEPTWQLVSNKGLKSLSLRPSVVMQVHQICWFITWQGMRETLLMIEHLILLSQLYIRPRFETW